MAASKLCQHATRSMIYPQNGKTKPDFPIIKHPLPAASHQRRKRHFGVRAGQGRQFARSMIKLQNSRALMRLFRFICITNNYTARSTTYLKFINFISTSTTVEVWKRCKITVQLPEISYIYNVANINICLKFPTPQTHIASMASPLCRQCLGGVSAMVKRYMVALGILLDSLSKVLNYKYP